MSTDLVFQLLGYSSEELQKSFTLTELSRLFYNFNITHDDEIYLRKDCRIYDSTFVFTLETPSFEYPINDCTFVINDNKFADDFDPELLVNALEIPTDDEFLFLHTNPYLYKLRSSIIWYLTKNKLCKRIFVFLKDSSFYYIPKVQLCDKFAVIQPLNIKEYEDLQKFIENRIIEIDTKFKNRL